MLRRTLFIFALLALAATALAQTRVTATRRSYLFPGDSLYAETALEAGDVLSWSLWLADAPAAAGNTVLTVESSVAGELARRDFGPAATNASDEVRIPRAALYVVKVKTSGERGRVAELGTWFKLSTGTSVPMPLPAVKKDQHTLAAGDKYVVSFDFTLPDTIGFQRLLALDVPLDIVTVHMVTPVGDTIAATPSVKRWIGDPGKFSLRDRAPRGGRITLRYEMEAGESGDAGILIEPGAHLPAWLPNQARLVTAHQHDPWSAVIVPAAAAFADSLAAHPPLPPQAGYAAQSFRARGMDPLTINLLTAAYGERDSLAALRHARELQERKPDTTFILGQRAFLPPELHLAEMMSLLQDAHAVRVRPREIKLEWFVENRAGQNSASRLYEWSYDEARLAPVTAADEFCWDNSLLPLKPDRSSYAAGTLLKPSSLTLSPPKRARADSLVRDGIRFVVADRRVWGYFLSNLGDQTEYLVYRETHPIARPLASGFKRWPVGARYAVFALGIIAIVGVWALIELRQRERRRRKRAEEYAAELEKARQVQLKLLPQSPLEVEGLQLFGMHQSMQSVGGDYYDFFPLADGRMVICVADVTGHGLPAALLMSNFQATLRAIIRTGKPLVDIVNMLNQDVFARTSPENFVTAILAEISADRTMITYCNAGHNPGYILRPSGNIEELDAGGIMLGALEMFPFIQMETGLERGDLLAFYTDGIPEAELGLDDMFGYDRLKLYLDNFRDRPLTAIARGLIERVTPSGATAIEDDMALVLVRVTR
jgi:serine phosphatase RsbU (regulator of sigma subunit)